MLSHADIWQAIDRLAARNGLTASGLARRSGLDPTTFNRSKRATRDGKPRWPSTESIAKVLLATNSSLFDFVRLIDHGIDGAMRRIPMLGYAQAGAEGTFDERGCPVLSGWKEIAFPDIDDPALYALEISGDSMAPVYRDGDIIIVSPQAPVRRGDRVVVRTTKGEVMAKELQRRSTTRVEFASLNPSAPDLSLAAEDVAWIARIIWASQ
ncbi:MAG: helix-turn-helix transcriptional regulator [Rhodospirillales bacterium]|nr:helix-turn-helix transcriptional regulator [Rhodospirillales bacterium]